MNGLAADSSLPDAHRLRTEKDQPARRHGISLETGDKGFMLYMPEKTEAAKPVQIIRATDNNACHNRITMKAGSRSDVLLLYPPLDGKTVENNDTTEIRLEENAILNIILLQEGDPTAQLQTKTVVRQAAGSRMTIHYAALSGKHIRNELCVSLDGRHAEHQAYGLAFTENAEHTGNEIQIIHASPECKSNQLFKQILSGASTGAFAGKVTVCKDAQKTTARQRSSNILLNLKAKMNIQPHLEIYADDVKCSHGATVGQLNDEALFYLRTRGISNSEAKKILLRAFLEEVVETIQHQYIKDIIMQKIMQKMEKNH
ncbi:MAG: Fe-S cluster assembly protein SufD [Bacteroidales bacterium]|jgi:Fe-S cluster assembly protein SufD|nr:Fe-S cluster assembly protein SufD [Bacteroidales bacterium]